MKDTVFLNNVLQIKNNNIRKILNKNLMNQFAKEIYLNQSDILTTNEGQNIRGFNAFYKYIKKLNKNGEISESLAKSFNQLIIKSSKNISLTNREAESLNEHLTYRDILSLKNYSINFDIPTCYEYNHHIEKVEELLIQNKKDNKDAKRIEKDIKNNNLSIYNNEIKNIKLNLKKMYDISDEKLHIYELLTHFSLFLSSNAYRSKPNSVQSIKEHKLIQKYITNILTYFEKEDVNVRRFNSLLIIKTSLFNTNIFGYNEDEKDFKDSWIIVDTKFLDVNGYEQLIYDLDSFQGNITAINRNEFISLIDIIKISDRQLFTNYATMESLAFSYNQILLFSFFNSDTLKKFNKNQIEKLDF